MQMFQQREEFEQKFNNERWRKNIQECLAAK
jgi:hypothetical protein